MDLLVLLIVLLLLFAIFGGALWSPWLLLVLVLVLVLGVGHWGPYRRW